MKKNRLLLTLTTLLVGVALFFSCQKTDVTGSDQKIPKLKVATIGTTACPAEDYILYGGQTTEMGTLKVWNDETKLYVTYTTTEAYPMNMLHLWVGTNPADVPKNKSNVPVPGKFPYKYGDGLATFNTYTFEILLSDIFPAGTLPENYCAKDLAIFAHAVAGEETLWSEGTAFDTSRWGWYSTYTVCCEDWGGEGEGELECTEYQYETAFGGTAPGAGSAWWYYYTGTGAQIIWAGQNMEAGYVEVASGIMTITLQDGWELNLVNVDPDTGIETPNKEPVKVQGYNTLPASRPAAGKFKTYKGTSLSFPVPAYAYYVIHLDVQKCKTWGPVQ